MDSTPKCPICGSELSYDEVDIGVGVQTGNYRCDCCGWYPDRDDDDAASLAGEFV